MGTHRRPLYANLPKKKKGGLRRQSASYHRRDPGGYGYDGVTLSGGTGRSSCHKTKQPS